MNPALAAATAAVLALAQAGPIATAPDRSAVSAPPPSLAAGPCAQSVYRQFDFLLGDWTLSEAGGTEVQARVHGAQAPGGCGIFVTEEAVRGPSSTSLIAYDPDATLWRIQSVHGDGVLDVAQGGPQNGEMVLEGDQTGPQGHQLVRLSWKAEGEIVRQTVQRSPDGQTWTTVTDRELRRGR